MPSPEAESSPIPEPGRAPGTSHLAPRICPACGSDEEGARIIPGNLEAEQLDELAFASRKPPEYMHHRLVECPACDLLYANPAPPSEELESAYGGAAYDSAEEARFASVTYARLLVELLPELPAAGGALDIGAGDGAFLRRLIECGFEPREVTGVEPSAAPIAAADPNIRPLIRKATFDPGDFQSASFRLLTSFQTIEHVPDPRLLCEGARELLVPGGALLLVAHDRRSLANRALGRRSPIFDVQHMQVFSRRSLEQLLIRSGFERVRLRRIVNRYPLRYWLRLSPLPAALTARLLPSRVGSMTLSLPVGNIAATGFRPEA